MPSIEKDGGDSLAELVTMGSRDVELGPAFTGDATLELFAAPGEELAALEPREMIAGYWRQVGATFDGGTRLA
jgi:acetoacetate decarboxylase